MQRTRTHTVINTAGLLLWWVFVFDRYPPALLFSDTVLTGGDAASWYQIVQHLQQQLLPHGRLVGWDQGNFFGYPDFQYYFIPPFLLAALLGHVLPLTVALKLVTFLGVLLFPLAVFCALRLMKYAFPVPLTGAWAATVFLFHEHYNMFGGNVLSTLAGEFCYSLAFALMVWWMGSLHRGMAQHTRLVRNGVVLGVIGLSHAFVFMVAALMPVYFVLGKQGLRRNITYVLGVYGLAFLVMAFWAVPMLAQFNYTTPINMIWRFYERKEFLDAAFYELALTGGLAMLLALFRPFRRHHSAFFMYMALVSVFLYLAATALKIADIRFFPPVLFFCLMAIVDAVACVWGQWTTRPSWAHSALITVAVLTGGLWIYDPGAQGPAWYRWNYSGYEAKPAWREGAADQLAHLLRAASPAPRVAWEKAVYDPYWGSDRVFENLPLFTGRPGTEGIHYAGALLSKEITWMHGEYSLYTASPEPLIYSHYNIAILPARFRMFNIQDFIATTPQITALLKDSGQFDERGRAGPLTVFRLRGYTPHYVETPSYLPHVVDVTRANWRQRFYAWFRRGEHLDVPLVAGHLIPRVALTRYFGAQRAALDDYGVVRGLRHTPVPHANIRDESLDDESIRFTTDRPGLPHIIKVAYSPNWHSRQGEPVFAVSPGLMLIYPQTARVELDYGRHWSEYAGGALTLSGLGLVLYVGVRRRAGAQAWLAHPAARRARVIVAPLRVPLLLLAGATALYLAVWSYQAKQAVFQDFQQGSRLAAQGRVQDAVPYFQRAAGDANIARLDNSDVPLALLSLGRAYMQLGRDGDAQTTLERLLYYYPMWIYAHEAHFHLGELAVRRGRTADAQNHYRACLRIDYYSGYRVQCATELARVSGGAP